ncbi:TPA: hypothetical protein ACX6RM_004033 [Photobacterium damselae]
MNKLTCGLCGFKFERGMRICQGCHGKIEYGSGLLKWINAGVFGGSAWLLMFLCNKYIFGINESLAGWIILIAALTGFFRSIKKHKYSYCVTKKVPK